MSNGYQELRDINRLSQRLRLRIDVVKRKWCEIQIDTTKQGFSICGHVGDLLKRSEITKYDEIYMVNTRWVFALEGTGQIINDLRQFFPECKPHLCWHLTPTKEVPASTLRWAKMFCSDEQQAVLQGWRDNGAEYEGAFRIYRHLATDRKETAHQP